MKWVTLTSATACPVCRVDQPAGAAMAEYNFGPKGLRRCATCEQKASHLPAEWRNARERSFRTVPDECSEAEAISIQAAYSKGFGEPISALPVPPAVARRSASRPRQTGKLTPFHELSEAVRKQHAAAVGER